MKIKITPFTKDSDHWEKEFIIGKNYYCAKFYTAGVITLLQDDDDWLSYEMSWISKSELPFLTALRHSLLTVIEDQGIISIVPELTPILSHFQPLYQIVEVNTFPSKDECYQLLSKFIDASNLPCRYSFYKRRTSLKQIKDYYRDMNKEDGLLLRAMASIHKAYILLNTNSSTFAEEIYLNLYRAMEALIEFVKETYKVDKKEALEILDPHFPDVSLVEYEKEMREGIRNDITHPLRNNTEPKRIVSNPYLIADMIYEDLAFVDYLLKRVLSGNINHSK